MSFILLVEQAAPETPSANQVVFYPKSDGLLYSKDDAGTERLVSAGGITLATEVASTSGTAIDFTGIPAGTDRIVVMFFGVSTNSTSNYLVQIGDSGGIEASGYVSSAQTDTAARVTSTAGFIITSSIGATNPISGMVILTLEDSTANTWIGISNVSDSGGVGQYGQGHKTSLDTALTQVRITTVSADTFDAGALNITYE